jgi:hypothetical protein
MFRRATECRQLAAVEQHLETERILLEVAQEWERIARWRGAYDERPPDSGFRFWDGSIYSSIGEASAAVRLGNSVRT